MNSTLINVHIENIVVRYVLKITDKLSALLEDMKATKLTEKIFVIYDDTKAAQKSKKRSHPEDKDKDKDAKKSRFRDDEAKTEKPTETQLSADKVRY